MMRKSARAAGLVFLVLSVVEVISLASHIMWVNAIVKPLLMPSLAVAALCALLPEQRGWKTALLAGALALHTAGDVLLLLHGPVLFAAGLVAFLLGHICYLVILFGRMGRCHGWREKVLCLQPALLAPLIVSLFDTDGAMRALLPAYALALLFVPTGGGIWLLRGRTTGWRIVIGGVLFVASDTLIAMNVFNGIDFPLHQATMMGTYLLAEWLIVSAIVRHLLHAKSSDVVE